MLVLRLVLTKFHYQSDKAFIMKYPTLLLSTCVLRISPMRPLISFQRKVFTSAMEDHVKRTIKSYRQYAMSDASVMEIEVLSPTVLGLKLIVNDHNLTFCAGQWVDVFIPNISQIGGFSMCSPPLLMEQSHQIHLAVKKSSWPPAEWVHSSCKAGDKVQIRVGGDFYYDPPSNSQIPDLVFIAGGVGINPLLSIMLHLKTLFKTPNNEDNLPKRITLLHCAKQIEELLFQETISELKNALTKTFDYHYFVTRPTVSLAKQEDIRNCQFKESRITEEDLRMVISKSNKIDNLICFICGPPPMTDHFCSQLANMGVLPNQIKYEKWW